MREGWRSVPLQDLIERIETIDPRKTPAESFTYIDVSSVSRATLAVAETTRIFGAEAPSRARRLVREGDVIFATIRPTLQRIAQITAELGGAVCSTGYFVLRPQNIVVGRYLFYWLQGETFSNAMEKLQRGASYPAVSDTDVKKQLVFLPSLAEQKRIVAILDEAFAGIDAAIANTEKNLANVRELFESYLNSIFTLESGCSKRSFSDSSVLEIVDGDRGKNYPKKQDFSTQGHCLFLNTKNVRPDGFRFDSLMFISEDKDSALGKGKLKRRDVILTTRGTVGNVAIFDSSVKFDHVRINSGMLILRANEQVILADYLFELLRSPIVQSQISSLTTGAAQPQLPIKTLINFKIPIPDSLEMQRAFVSRIREFQTEFRRLESIYVQKHKTLTELKQSILQKAFTGELTAENMENEAREAVI